MAALRDPECIENRNIMEMAPLSGSRVLEVGCADGHMTWRYAPYAARVVAIDPNPSRLAVALRNRPSDLREKVGLMRVRAEALPFRDESFEVVILGWVL